MDGCKELFVTVRVIRSLYVFDKIMPTREFMRVLSKHKGKISHRLHRLFYFLFFLHLICAIRGNMFSREWKARQDMLEVRWLPSHLTMTYLTLRAKFTFMSIFVAREAFL